MLMGWCYDLFTNPFLLTAISSWFAAQILKTIINAIINKKLRWARLIGDGGMPSGHSATVASLATLRGLLCGFSSFEFGATAILAIIVCHDATGVRQETGKQAVLLNEMIRAFEGLGKDALPEVKLKEFVGHTPIQVLAGILIGISNAALLYLLIFQHI